MANDASLTIITKQPCDSFKINTKNEPANRGFHHFCRGLSETGLAQFTDIIEFAFNCLPMSCKTTRIRKRFCSTIGKGISGY